MFCLGPWKIKSTVHKQTFQIFTWIKRTLIAASSVIRMNGRQVTADEHFNDRLSALATRNIFSWTLFTEGIRTEEKCLWRHEWLAVVLDRDLIRESSDSDVSIERGEGDDQRIERIQRWQEDVLRSVE